MISLDEIDKTIIELEAKDTSYTVVERLAWLYTVKDHLQPQKGAIMTQGLNGSEFIEICSNKPYSAVMDILDEHFSIIKTVYPKEYTAIINKISEL